VSQRGRGDLDVSTDDTDVHPKGAATLGTRPIAVRCPLNFLQIPPPHTETHHHNARVCVWHGYSAPGLGALRLGLFLRGSTPTAV
jgi:hypothetical protein